MVRTAVELTAEELRTYRRTARLRGQRVRQGTVERRTRAWELARQAATLLRERFGAERVVVFGSLVHEGCFTLWSDVDLAAWGLRPEDTFRAIGAIQDLSPDIELNLVDVEACSPSLLAVIKAEGVEL
ncbi:nucleotidyltransferase domain-containing protein [Candidatus Bipolaricaulota bacterium]|nr:nucleotidyltransferase domain-containing protein [Candidatus Bipolaricaulota bacterium]